MCSKMGFSFCIVPLLLVLLLYTVSCEHENHHNHQNDDKWFEIVSKLEFLWKNKTDAPFSTTEPTQTNDNKGNQWHSHDVTYTTELSTSPVVQNGTLKENVEDAFKASMAFLIGVPIAGIIVLCCCCYCCCKCCAACCCEDEAENKIIVVQQNNVQPANLPPVQHTQVILQQPVYQTPVYGMQPAAPQWGPPPQQPQWAAPPQQPPQYPPGAYDNPNYSEPSAPPPQYGQKY